MSNATRSEGHRIIGAQPSWLPVLQGYKPSQARHHKPGAHSAGPDGSAPLLRRAASAGAVWMVAFGLFALAEGWKRPGLIALILSALVALGVVASCLVAMAPDSDPDSPGPRMPGVNSRRNGYVPRT